MNELLLRELTPTVGGLTTRQIAQAYLVPEATMALGRGRLGEFQAQAAIAALHADAPRAEETDWVQIVGWYDELLRLTGSPVVQLNQAVAIGEADGPQAGLTVATVDPPPAPPLRRLGVPPREGGRPADCGTVVRRRGPVRPQPRRT